MASKDLITYVIVEWDVCLQKMAVRVSNVFLSDLMETKHCYICIVQNSNNNVFQINEKHINVGFEHNKLGIL